jgi:hypothetical protein
VQLPGAHAVDPIDGQRRTIPADAGGRRRIRIGQFDPVGVGAHRCRGAARAGLDIEDVGEVGAELDREPHGDVSSVGRPQLQVVTKPRGDPAAPNQQARQLATVGVVQPMDDQGVEG